MLFRSNSCCVSCVSRYCSGPLKKNECMFCHVKYCIDFISSLSPKYRSVLESNIKDELFSEQSKYFASIQGKIFESLGIYKSSMEQIEKSRANIEHLDTLINEVSLLELSGKLPDNYILESLRETRGNILRSSERKSKAVKAFEKSMKEMSVSAISAGQCKRDGCIGYIGTSGCCICRWNYCNACNKYCDLHSHVCDIDDINSFDEIKRSSTQCPGCKAYVTKICGCDSAFCTACHTSFRFGTGEKTGREHNIHLEEYKRGKYGILRDAQDIWTSQQIGFALYKKSNLIPHTEYLRHCIIYLQNIMVKYSQKEESLNNTIKYVIHGMKSELDPMFNDILRFKPSLSITEFKSKLLSDYKKRSMEMKRFNILKELTDKLREHFFDIVSTDIYSHDPSDFEKIYLKTSHILLEHQGKIYKSSGKMSLSYDLSRSRFYAKI